MSATPDELRFRQVAGRLPTGVTILGVADRGAPEAMTVNSFTTVSLNPRLILVCLRRGCRIQPALTRARSFAVTVLGAGQHEVSRHFANPRRPAGFAGFAGIGWSPAPTGSPVLHGAVAYFDCELHDTMPAGDHDVIVGRVRDFDASYDVDPLLFLDSAYAQPSQPMATLATA